MRYAPHTLTHVVSCHANERARDPKQRATMLKGLRQRIAQIEGRAPAFGVPLAGPSLDHSFSTTHSSTSDPTTFDPPTSNPHEDGGVFPRKTPPSTPSSSSSFPCSSVARTERFPAVAWTFGEAFLDHAIGPMGLAADGVHEIKPARLPLTASPGDGAGLPQDERMADWSAAWGAARLLALTLAIRRMTLLRSQNPDAQPVVLWCQPASASRDLGGFYAQGLARLGLSPGQLIIVETRRADETLWTLEEALRAGSLALVVGQLDAVDLTPARRLALAAQQSATPCLLLTHPGGPPAAATASRWRVRPSVGGSHPLQAIAEDVVRRLPGPPRLRLSPERLRGRALFSGASGHEVEWCDETFCFRMATPLRHRADGARRTARHSA